MSDHPAKPRSDEGFLLLALVVACFLLILVLGIAAPRVARQLERDREVESEHRAQEYVRAIQLYYRKYQRFPTSTDQLLGSGTTGVSSATNVKFLRQQYKDPLTHEDYRLIQVGTAKTEVKGFFGEPLPGTPAGSLGAVSGLQSGLGAGASAIGGSTPGSAAGSGTSLGTGLGFGSSSAGGSPSGTAAGTGTTATGAASASGTSLGAGVGSSAVEGGAFSGTSATTFQGSKTAFLGVASNATGHGLVEWNGSENIEDWEFLYDPRVELLKAKVSIFGGSPAASGTGSLGGTIGAGSTSIFAPQTTGTGSSGLNGAAGTPTSGSPAGTTGIGTTPRQ